MWLNLLRVIKFVFMLYALMEIYWITFMLTADISIQGTARHILYGAPLSNMWAHCLFVFCRSSSWGLLNSIVAFASLCVLSFVRRTQLIDTTPSPYMILDPLTLRMQPISHTLTDYMFQTQNNTFTQHPPPPPTCFGSGGNPHRHLNTLFISLATSTLPVWSFLQKAFTNKLTKTSCLRTLFIDQKPQCWADFKQFIILYCFADSSCWTQGRCEQWDWTKL